jgi:hypothetical protein
MQRTDAASHPADHAPLMTAPSVVNIIREAIAEVVGG